MAGEEAQDRRLYGEKDVSRILKRATEIQGKAGAPEAHGLTLAELQQIAREAGIAPGAVAAAAAELGAVPEKDLAFHPLGGPVSFTRDRVLAGEVSEEAWEAMLDEIRKTYHVIGTSSRVGRSLEWTYSERAQQAQVAVTARNGRVKIRVTERNVKTTLFTFLPVLWTVMFMVGFVAEGTLAWPAALALLGAVFVAARFAFAALAGRKERKAQQLLQRLELLVEPPAQPAPAAAETASTKAVIAEAVIAEAVIAGTIITEAVIAEAEPAAPDPISLHDIAAPDEDADAWDRLPERRRSRS